MTARVRLGMLTPSSNTVLEPMTAAILSGLPEVTAHFSRFRVTEITLGEAALGQFGFEPILAAADLLADAKVDAIAWNGTSGGWLGIGRDRALAEALTARTGAPATTSTLATLEAFAALGAESYGLVTPYLDEVQAAILETFAGEGLSCAAERHLGDRGNFSFAEFTEETIADMVRAVAEARPGAIAIYCTNFAGTRVAPALEAELGLPVLDSVSVTAWATLRAAGADPRRVAGWGRIFDCA